MCVTHTVCVRVCFSSAIRFSIHLKSGVNVIICDQAFRKMHVCASVCVSLKIGHWATAGLATASLTDFAFVFYIDLLLLLLLEYFELVVFAFHISIGLFVRFDWLNGNCVVVIVDWSSSYVVKMRKVHMARRVCGHNIVSAFFFGCLFSTIYSCNLIYFSPSARWQGQCYASAAKCNFMKMKKVLSNRLLVCLCCVSVLQMI